MNAAAKVFIVMLLTSLLLGLIIFLTNPDYRVKNIYETNKNYYPQITEESVKHNFTKLFSKKG
jgi:hypothetical protein